MMTTAKKNMEDRAKPNALPMVRARARARVRVRVRVRV